MFIDFHKLWLTEGSDLQTQISIEFWRLVQMKTIIGTYQNCF